MTNNCLIENELFSNAMKESFEFQVLESIGKNLDFDTIPKQANLIY